MSYTLAVIGAGGKTTALRQLAARYADRRVLLTTTTHIFPVLPPESRVFLPDPNADTLAAALQSPGVVCAGVPAMLAKIAVLPPHVLGAGISAADLTLIEADGAHHLPLKLHRADEPVMPPRVDHCLIIAGLGGLGMPVSGVCHRYALQWKNSPERITGCEEIGVCIRDAVSACCLPGEKLTVLLSQMRTPQQYAAAEEIAARLCADGLDVRLWPHKSDIPFSLPI